MNEPGPAARMGYDQSYARVQKVRYSHDAMIDQIIGNPSISQNELSAVFGYTPAWVSRVIGSDAFQARLAERKGELVDPLLVASIEERLRGLAMFSIEKVMEKLEMNPTMDGALKALELSTKALGYGARDTGPKTVNNYVAMLPPKSENVGEWLEQYKPQARVAPMPTIGPELAELIEYEPVVEDSASGASPLASIASEVQHELFE
jgi:hypothetical protein